jgi:copper chaperone CopZ
MPQRELNVQIEGMHCGGCVTRVTGALRKLEGVEVQQVEVGSARVLLAGPAEPAAVLEAIHRIGFTAREA